jgi:hypothetical protein
MSRAMIMKFKYIGFLSLVDIGRVFSWQFEAVEIGDRKVMHPAG